MAVALSTILSVAGFCRAIFFKTAFVEAVAVTAALAMIVFSSICLGAVLPIFLERIGVDPAHSSTTIQGKMTMAYHVARKKHLATVLVLCSLMYPIPLVIMDILGVILAVSVSRTILDGPFGAFLVAKLGGG